MPRIRLFHWTLVAFTIASLILSCALIPAVAQQESQDIRSVPLFQSGVEVNKSGTRDVTPGFGLDMHQEGSRGISIGSQFYKAQFVLWTRPGHFGQFTFSADPKQYSMFKVKAGVRDEWRNGTSIHLKIFQGGNIVKNYQGIRNGKLITDINLRLDDRAIDGANNIGVRLDCISGSDACGVDFVQADLIPSENFVQPSEMRRKRSSTGQPEQTTQQPSGNSSGVDSGLRILDLLRSIFQ